MISRSAVGSGPLFAASVAPANTVRAACRENRQSSLFFIAVDARTLRFAEPGC
jgi:hypothetical protein